MIKLYRYVWLTLLLAVIATGILLYTKHNAKITIHQFTKIHRQAKIQPDYNGIIIPPNIAPLNFMVMQEGKQYYVKIYSKQGEPIEVSSKTAKIIIPNRSWSKLLNINRGREIYYDVFVQNRNNQWRLFNTISNKIANEDIDKYLVYRKMHPTYTHSQGPMGVYQRNLSTFEENVILDNSFYGVTCLNCHAFYKNNPAKMLLGVRSYEGPKPGTLLTDDGEPKKIDAKFGYTSWHPSGKLAVYCINNLPMYFHLRSSRDEVRDTINLDSAMAYYLADEQVIKTAPQLSRKDRLENWPAWAPDGKYLYFCSAPMLWPLPSQMKVYPPKQRDQVKYDLMRISYDLQNDKWGQLETLISAQDAGGLSIAMPHISPDGRWLLFCMFDYGYFPPWKQNSDLYIIDLEKAEQSGIFEPRRLEINSNQSEAWQNWSSNSRWIVFSSKRLHGTFTRSYISFVDTLGNVSRPMLLPQKDPDFYNGCLLAYNTPEFISTTIKHVKGELAQVYRDSDMIKVDMPITMATPQTDTTYKQPSLWRDRE